MSEEIPTEEFKLDENLNLGSELSPPSFEEWKAQVEKDLKGASYEKKLITKTPAIINAIPTERSRTPFSRNIKNPQSAVITTLVRLIAITYRTNATRIAYICATSAMAPLKPIITRKNQFCFICVKTFLFFAIIKIPSVIDKVVFIAVIHITGEELTTPILSMFAPIL